MVVVVINPPYLSISLNRAKESKLQPSTTETVVVCNHILNFEFQNRRGIEGFGLKVLGSRDDLLDKIEFFKPQLHTIFKRTDIRRRCKRLRLHQMLL